MRGEAMTKTSQQPTKLTARRRARECAVQTMYAWEISKNSAECVELDYLTHHTEETVGADMDYFRKIFRGTTENLRAIDEKICPNLDRKLNNLNPIERSILRLATYELMLADVPYKVVINEAIEVAKSFGAEESHRYINGVLDKIANGKN